jgi:hypothetical protein
MAKTAQAVLDGTLDACAAETACREGFPNLREELRAIFARLNAGSVRVAVPGLAGAAQLHAGRVAEFLRSRLYRPQGAADVPWMIHAAYGGDWGPIVEGILSGAREVDGALSFGLFFAITCGEDVAFLREEDVGPASQGTLLGDYRIRQQQRACTSWPKASLPADYRLPVHAAVPTLFVSGDIDSATPLWFTERAAAGFSQRVQVVARGLGHTERSACIDRLYERFVRSGSARGLEGSTCPAVPRPPFKLR